MTGLCSHCGLELGFDPLDNEVYDYVDILCEGCYQDMDNVDDDWLPPPVEFSHADFLAVNEMDCD